MDLPDYSNNIMRGTFNMKDDPKEISPEDQEKMLLQLYRSYDDANQDFLDTIKDNADCYQKLKDAK
mgnify:CR=1 FL=1